MFSIYRSVRGDASHVEHSNFSSIITSPNQSPVLLQGFLASAPHLGWINKAKMRLGSAIERAESADLAEKPGRRDWRRKLGGWLAEAGVFSGGGSPRLPFRSREASLLSGCCSSGPLVLGPYWAETVGPVLVVQLPAIGIERSRGVPLGSNGRRRTRRRF
jgi:hypothetical protein